MLAAAYAVADGGPTTLSPEMQLLREVNRFGVSAVMGRPLYYHEIIRLRAAEAVIRAYTARESSENWAQCAKDHPDDSRMLNLAMRLAGEYGWE